MLHPRPGLAGLSTLRARAVLRSPQTPQEGHPESLSRGLGESRPEEQAGLPCCLTQTRNKLLSLTKLYQEVGFGAGIVLQCRHSISAPVQFLAALFAMQLSNNIPGKATEHGPSQEMRCSSRLPASARPNQAAVVT